jgi:hypothetical protein
MKIVLFGATGNVGQRKRQGSPYRRHEVVGVVRDPERARAPDPRVKLVPGDATDATSVPRVAKGRLLR